MNEFQLQGPFSLHFIHLRVLLFSLCVFILIPACGENDPLGSSPETPAWNFLGFEDHFAVEIEIKWPYLYACAARDGLYRKRIDREGEEWEYLGLADTSAAGTPDEHNVRRGVQDVLILSNGDILAGLSTETKYAHGLFRSRDDGKSWETSDEGMFNPWIEHSSMVCVLEQNKCIPNMIYAATTNMVFRSVDAGLSWMSVSGRYGGSRIIHDICTTPEACCTMWQGGYTGASSSFVGYSPDCGDSWNYLDLFGIIPGTGVYDIEMDPNNTNILYIGILGFVLKSPDQGITLNATAFRMSGFSPFLAIEIVGKDGPHIFAAGGVALFESLDGGNTAIRISAPISDFVMDMDYDVHSHSLYIATLAGIYEYRLDR